MRAARSVLTLGRPAPVLLAALAAGAACAAPAGSDTALRVAADFTAATADGDAERVCALLAPATARQLAQQAASCPEAAGALSLPAPAEPLPAAQVWGRSALVAAPGTSVFLVRVDDRWLVSAAGCTLRPQAPADCALQGG
ncbi:hypothetical protein [Kineococcus indalonis]|uniref:hypothetical protein n=1 Tax=Kineococcus indalonis TaxID=2696566 RepID=UPI001412CAA4|nr:hypothetical protein [Kineococcus indalonis]NAZ86861.1 hypothetical protein [Kineococcus indalonis]